MSNYETLSSVFVNASFEAKMIVNVSKNNGYVNIGVSILNGKEFETKLGHGHKAQLTTAGAQKLIDALVSAIALTTEQTTL